MIVDVWRRPSRTLRIASIVLATFCSSDARAQGGAQPYDVPTHELSEARPGHQTAANSCDEDCRDQADLIAQQQMAKAAWAMFWATIASVAVGLGSLVLIVFTLVYTRRAALATQATAKEAARSTEAAITAAASAKEANAIGRLAIAMQSRAWVTFVGFEFTFMKNVRLGGENQNNALGIQATWKNTGTTPALRVSTLIRYEIIDRKHDKIPQFYPDHESSDMNATIGPGVDVGSLRFIVNNDDIARIQKGHARLFVYSSVQYNITFDSKSRFAEITAEVVIGQSVKDDKGREKLDAQSHMVGSQNNAT